MPQKHFGDSASQWLLKNVVPGPLDLRISDFLMIDVLHSVYCRKMYLKAHIETDSEGL